MSNVSGFTTAQIAILSTTQIQSLTTADIASLTTAQVAALTTDQMVALQTSQIIALTTAGVAALKTDQIQSIETRDIAALTTNQVISLNTAGVAALTTDQVQAITTAGIAALRTAQVVALNTDSVVALKTSQITALTTAGVAALTTIQAAVIETADIAALSTAQIKALTTTDIAALTTSQAAALTTGQVEALTTSQISAFTTEATQQLALGTPIILDLNGDGVKSQSVSAGVKFDLFADGRQVNTGWVSSGDGLLVLDRNHDGLINDGSELFGSSTTLTSGQKAADGYMALRELDSNQDGILSQEDAIFNDLRIWVDGNSDGISETGEIKSLAALSITKIDLHSKVELSKDNGNLVGLTSSYETVDGATHAAADVWFVADKHANSANSITPSDNANVDDAIAALGSTKMLAAESTTSAVLNIPKVATLAQDPQTPEVKTDLRSRVTNLAQALGSFDLSSAVENGLSTPRLDVQSGVGSTNTTVSLTVGSMVDVMKQFDSNGNMVASQGNAVVALGKSLTLPGIQDPANNGFLATGK